MLDSTKPYLAVARAMMQQTLVFRGTTFLYTAAWAFGLLAQLSLWRAVLDGGGHFGDYDWEHLRTYLVLGFLVNSIGSGGGFQLQSRIQSGDVAMDLLRPLNFQKARFAEALGSIAIEVIMAAIVVGFSVLFFGPLVFPEAAATWILYLLSIAGAMVIKFTLSYSTGLTAFKTTSMSGVNFTRIAITNLLSGALIPLTLFPDVLQLVAFILPFQAIVFTPNLIFLERISTLQMLGLIGIQAFWCVAMWFFARSMWGWTSRALTIQGG